jgi:glycosyltransferase involved in cell wall biosynthesis
MRAMEKPTISIVIPVLNSRATLARCLDSALAQKDASCEVVVVDGASTDGSLDILRGYGERRQGRGYVNDFFHSSTRSQARIVVKNRSAGKFLIGWGILTYLKTYLP